MWGAGGSMVGPGDQTPLCVPSSPSGPTSISSPCSCPSHIPVSYVPPPLLSQHPVPFSLAQDGVCVCVCAKSFQSCLAHCDPMDCSPPGSSAHEILQLRILEWVAISFSRGSSWPRDRTCLSCLAGRFLTAEPPGKPEGYNT